MSETIQEDHLEEIIQLTTPRGFQQPNEDNTMIAFIMTKKCLDFSYKHQSNKQKIEIRQGFFFGKLRETKRQ